MQLIVGAQVETAADRDSHAVEPMLDDLEQRDLLPEQLQADMAYGSNDNVNLANERGTELISPCPIGRDKHRDPHRLNTDDFVVDEDSGLITRCPAGHKPSDAWHDPDKDAAMAIMNPDHCSACAYSEECPVTERNLKGNCGRRGRHLAISVTAKERQRHARLREEQTAAFRNRYRLRAGIEGTFGNVKRCTGLGRVRRRGRGSVTMSVLLKVAGWNLLRSAASTTMRKKIGKLVARLVRACFFAYIAEILASKAPKSRRGGPKSEWPSTGVVVCV